MITYIDMGMREVGAKEAHVSEKGKQCPLHSRLMVIFTYCTCMHWLIQLRLATLQVLLSFDGRALMASRPFRHVERIKHTPVQYLVLLIESGRKNLSSQDPSTARTSDYSILCYPLRHDHRAIDGVGSEDKSTFYSFPFPH